MGVFVTAINKLIIIFLLVLIGCFAKEKDFPADVRSMNCCKKALWCLSPV